MKKRKDFVERRRWNRFKVKDGVFVEFFKPRFLNLRKPHLVKSAPITDVSLGGLSFQYIDDNMWSLNFDELDISNSETASEIKIAKMPFKAVSDSAITRLSNFMFKRRCGIKFGKLTLNQNDQLQRFIQNYAV
ncbi:MAG: hypothetical protein ACYTEE_06685 [Planctomycetota bacterium]|jgi:hypothetical protein